MPQWIALSRTQHADHCYLSRDGYHFAVNQPVANVLLAELSKLLPHYALGFIKQEASYQAVALLSLDGQTNLYVAPNGKWLGNYVPASLRGYPFTLANTEDGQKAPCVDQAHLSEDQGEPLFDDDGNLAATVQKRLEFLNQCEQNRQVTQACVQKLEDAGVIEEWPLQIGRGEGQDPLKVNGLHRISEQALNSLNAETLHGLRGGPLSLAYAQLFSISQLSQLSERAKFQAKHAESGEPPEDIETLFGEDDDELNFDFDS
jgi:hypothetical protein